MVTVAHRRRAALAVVEALPSAPVATAAIGAHVRLAERSQGFVRRVARSIVGFGEDGERLEVELRLAGWHADDLEDLKEIVRRAAETALLSGPTTLERAATAQLETWATRQAHPSSPSAIADHDRATSSLADVVGHPIAHCGCQLCRGRRERRV
jgi:hypothetical protein